MEYTADPIRRQVELTGDSTETDKLFSDLARVKYQKWEYEDEYRMLVPLKDCVEIDGNRFLRFNDHLRLRSVILGCRYSDADEHILRLAAELGAEVVPTRMAWKGYTIRRCGRRSKRLERKMAAIVLEESTLNGERSKTEA